MRFTHMMHPKKSDRAVFVATEKAESIYLDEEHGQVCVFVGSQSERGDRLPYLHSLRDAVNAAIEHEEKKRGEGA